MIEPDLPRLVGWLGDLGWLASLIYWGSYLLIPLLVGGLWGAVRATGRVQAALLLLVALPAAVLIYGRFFEPYRLTLARHDVEVCGRGLPGTLTAAVVSDLHYGRYPNTPPLTKIVRAINDQNVDLVLMPGDFTYFLEPERLVDEFAPFLDLQAPAYAVMGNHDIGLKGLDYGNKLERSLAAAGVTVLNPGTSMFTARGKYLRIHGQRDWFEARFGGADLGGWPVQDGIASIVLQHHPMVARREATGPYGLMVAGHTHGGQIWIPKVTCFLTKACAGWRYGYKETPMGGLFVTSGIGMTTLPLRINVPPRIDLLNIKIQRCPMQRLTPYPAPALPK